MLDRLIPYFELFQAWFNNDFGENRLTERDWVVRRMVHNFFQFFFENTTCLSSSRHPISTLTMHKLHQMAQIFEAQFNHPSSTKPFKLCSECFVSTIFVCVHSGPTNIHVGIERVLPFHSNGTDIPYEERFEEAHALVYQVYSFYQDKYKSAMRNDDLFTHSSMKKSWEKYNDRLKVIAGSSINSSPDSASSNGDKELTSYLNTKFRNLFHDNLDVLNWWHIHESKYLILAIMARDILTVLVTGVSSEKAFSTAESMLDPCRNRFDTEDSESAHVFEGLGACRYERATVTI